MEIFLRPPLPALFHDIQQNFNPLLSKEDLENQTTKSERRREREMDDPAMEFCKFLRSYCDRLERNCTSLRESVDRKSIPLEFSTSFLDRLDRQVSSLSGDLESLGSMVVDTVSFEELLGHCNEIYKDNANRMAQLEDKMKELGIDLGLDDENVGEDPDGGSPISGAYIDLDSLSDSEPERKIIPDDPILDDSLSFRELGFSDAFLATLASEDDRLESPSYSSSEPSKYEKDNHINVGNGSDKHSSDISDHLLDNGDTLSQSAGHRIEVAKSDYDQLPFYLRILASWEELHEAVLKMNERLCGHGIYSFDQSRLESLGLGLKARSCLLVLLQMKRLVLESSVDGAVVYRVADL
ncbi:uncharacterized protein LOC116245735 isoform X2 [Nymphaea colorata]|uniref:uncharacterized protein LOC116245735 isoform X2 n=1 Tax=Nymphaea colorata TaxID=210225 RepID=UPI00214E3E1F|nr:uncharacterized protein LOC116245735 isoform X2 [Nymphaea colorata]